MHYLWLYVYMPTNRKMPQGFAHPLLLIIVLVIVGVSVAVFAGSKNLISSVLGAKTRSENIYQYQTNGIKVTVISPKSSWDLTEYLCDSKEQCQKSATSGKWWATVSGAPTTEDGHEVFIEQADGWKGYGFIKISVKSPNGTIYMLLNTSETSAIVDTTAPVASVTFTEPDASTN